MTRIADILAAVILAAALFAPVQAQDPDDPFGPESSPSENEPPLTSRESIERKLREIVLP